MEGGNPLSPQRPGEEIRFLLHHSRRPQASMTNLSMVTARLACSVGSLKKTGSLLCDRMLPFDPAQLNPFDEVFLKHHKEHDHRQDRHGDSSHEQVSLLAL